MTTSTRPPRVPLASTLDQPSNCPTCFRVQVAHWLLGLPIPDGRSCRWHPTSSREGGQE